LSYTREALVREALAFQRGLSIREAGSIGRGLASRHDPVGNGVEVAARSREAAAPFLKNLA